MDDEYLVMECILRGKENLYPQLLNDIINDMIKSLPAGKREYWQRLKEDKNKKETLVNMMKSFIARNYPSYSGVYKNYYKQTLIYSMFDFPARLSHYIDEDFKKEVRDYLNIQKDIDIFEYISGKLKEEWEIICKFLKNNPIQSEQSISSLLRKAIEYPKFYEEVQKCLPVSPPPANITDENIKDWINKYFDFYLYTRQINRPRNTQNFVDTFEKFLLKHYSKPAEFFTQHSILTLRQKIEEYLKINRKILLVIVDGLSYAYYKEIEKIFRKECSFLFSTLPTITEINKKRILSGLFDIGESYEQIIAKIYRNYRYKETNSDQIDLEAFLAEDLDLYIYWENQFDSYIHQSKAFDKRVKDHVEILLKISKHIEKFLDEGGIIILIGDHGYTTLPNEPNNKIITPVEGIKITHNRVLKTDSTTGNNHSINNVYWINKNVAVPEGYHYFNSLPRGATHGGVTPEEVVVPFLIIEKIEESLKPLKFKIADGKYLRRKKHATRLIIINPNMFMVKVTLIKFMPSIIKIFSPSPLLLKPNENIFDAELDLRTVTTEICKVFVEYRIDKNALEADFDIITTGAMKEVFNEWE